MEKEVIWTGVEGQRKEHIRDAVADVVDVCLTEGVGTELEMGGMKEGRECAGDMEYQGAAAPPPTPILTAIVLVVTALIDVKMPATGSVGLGYRCSPR